MLSGFLTLNAQASGRGVLGSTPGGCRITACVQK